MSEPIKQIAMLTVVAYNNGKYEINGPPDIMMSLHILSMAQMGLIEELIKTKQEHERTLIQKPGLRHVMELTKH